MGVVDPCRPFTHALRNGILQGCSSGCYRYNVSAQKFHSVYVQGLALAVDLAHEDNALHTEESCRCCCGNTVLACACLGDESCLAHFLGKKRLTKHVVDLVRTCVVKIFPLEIDLCAAQVLGHLLCIVEIGRTSCIFIQ